MNKNIKNSHSKKFVLPFRAKKNKQKTPNTPET